MIDQNQSQSAEGVNSLQPVLQAYLSQHASSINQIAQQLGVSPTAIANSFREFTYQ